jgi:hypothetical protein
VADLAKGIVGIAVTAKWEDIRFGFTIFVALRDAGLTTIIQEPNHEVAIPA